MIQLRHIVLIFAISSGLAACEVDKVKAPADVPRDTTQDATTDTRQDVSLDVAETSGGGLAGAFCTPNAEVTGCAEGLTCDNRINRCVECLIFEQRCTEAGVRQTCAVATIASDGAMRGGSFVNEPCGAGKACVPASQTSASCDAVVCEANFATCVSGAVRKACNAFGTAEVEETCDPGRACYEGICEFVRHNVVLVFDTSGSMHDYVDPQYQGSPIQCELNGTPCLSAFPACDAGEDPLTIFNLSKRVFSDVIAGTIGGYSQFALQRFPQRESGTNTANCWLGWYLPLVNNRMTGDDESHDTVATTWFSDNLSDVIAVPFPPRNNRDNSATILKWFDGSERLEATGGACTSNSQCGTGRCSLNNGVGVCAYHTDPELRAGGETPLGKSIFYAGEYLRRYVRVDGKPCVSDASCGSVGYVCRADVCVDPYRQCKDDFIILFTDGDETDFREETEFFNPTVQAKRLAYGLSCDVDADCRGDAKCESNACVGLHQIRGLVPDFVASDEASRALTNPWGVPVSIRTTVITLNSRADKNARIAYAGGGENLSVSADDPDDFRLRLRRATSPDFKCYPEDLD